MPVMRWNRDKPHRCPACHSVWTWSGEYHEDFDPKWWKTYDCYRCGAVFSGRFGPWLWQCKIRSKINYIRRGLKWRFDR